ncbi:MAG: hypothetical protein ACREPI_07050 [Candidatus Dormibacterales bacterium]
MAILSQLTWGFVFLDAALAAYLLGGVMVWGGRGVLARRSALATMGGVVVISGLLIWITLASLQVSSGAQRWTLVQAGWSACHSSTIGKKPVILDHCQVVGVFRNDGGSANGIDVFVAAFRARGGVGCAAPLSDLAQHGQSVTVTCTVVGTGVGTGDLTGAGGVDTSSPPQVFIESQTLAQELGIPSPSPS